jgi:hypothetical protein
MCPLYVLGVMDKLILDIGGIIVIRKKTAVLDKNLYQCQFIHHSFHTEYLESEPRHPHAEKSVGNLLILRPQ